MEIAQSTRHFKQAEDELAQRRQRLVDEIRHNDLLTQKVREDKQRWKRSLESKVGGQPFALVTQKRKGIPPVREVKASRLDDPQMQVMQITSHTATNSKGHPGTRKMGRVSSPLDIQLDNDRTHAYASDQPGTSVTALRSAGNLRPQTQIAALKDPAEEWHDHNPLAQYERELEASHDAAR